MAARRCCAAAAWPAPRPPRAESRVGCPRSCRGSRLRSRTQARPSRSSGTTEFSPTPARPPTPTAVRRGTIARVFSDQAWQRTQRLQRAILELPFNTELAAGTLASERFQFYLAQDSRYLIGFGKALAVAAAKADDHDE